MSGEQPLLICRTCNLNPPCLTSRRSQPPLALAVPLSRFTSRVGGGSAFFVRRHYTLMKTKPNKTYQIAALLFCISGFVSFFFAVINDNSMYLVPTRVTSICLGIFCWFESFRKMKRE